jgi:hypothetical protein
MPGEDSGDECEESGCEDNGNEGCVALGIKLAISRRDIVGTYISLLLAVRY